MKIAAITFGTEGDTRPLAALCKCLADAGHDACFLTEKSSLSLATSAGARPVALAGDIKSTMTDLLSSGSKAARASPMTDALSSLAKACTADWMRSLLEVASGCDAILAAGLPIYVGLSVSEHLGIPIVGVGLQPTSHTREFPNPFFPLAVPAWCNPLTHALVLGIIWRTFRDSINAARGEVLHEKPRSKPWRGYPVLFAISPHLLPRPSDWPDNFYVTGRWTLEEESWQLPKTLQDFLAAGEPPIYVGFGSMVGFDRDLVMREVLAGLDGRRALLSSGWNELGSSSLPSNVFPIGPVPHDQLFPRVSLVIHHGGAGTSHSAAAAGVPSVVVPFTGDQPFWASRLQWAGVAPESVPYKHLTSGLLRKRIIEASSDGMRQRAEVLGRLMREEKGVQTAVARLEQLLDPRAKAAILQS
ncbi:MAG TPA: glycosyltransferase [Candidatus Nanoarchaeia archaeon]|nr:glycosyltransferase [Candidatus Nanoarchaeia archaeon]